MNRKLRSKRGFSTVLISAMMLSTLSTMGVAVLGWSNTVVSTQENKINELYVEKSNALQEIFIMEDVWFDGVPGSKNVHVTVKNVGQLPIQITSITIVATKTSASQLINAGQSATISVPYEWTPNTLHNIVAESERGNTITQSWLA